MASKTIWTRLALDGSRFSRGLARANRDLAGFRRAAGSQLRNVGIAAGALAVGAGVIGAGFEQSMANVQSVTRASEKDLARLERQARGLGATTSFSASQASEALFNLSLQGLNVDQAIGASEASLKLAGATMSDLGESAELVAVQMAIFQKQGKTAGDVANVVTRATQVSALSFDRVRDAMTFAGPVAGQFNVRLEETTGALALLAKQGRFGSIAGSGLANVMLELTTNAKKYADIIPEGTLQTKGLAGVIRELELRGVPAEDIMGRLGKRAGPTMGVLLAAGSKGLREMEGALTGTQAAWEAYEVQQSTVRGAALRLRSALEELAIQAFDTVKVGLREGFDRAAKTVLAASGRIIGGLAKLIELVRTVAGWFSTLHAFLRDNAWAVQLLGGTVLALVGQLGVLSVAVGTYVKVAGFFATKLNVWLLVISAVIAAVSFLVQRLGGWRVVTIQLSAAVKRFGLELSRQFAVARLLVMNFGEVWSMLPEALQRVFEGSWRIFRIFLDNLKDGFGLLWDIISGKVGLSEAFDLLKAQLSAGMAEVVAEVRATATEAWAPFSEAHAAELAEIERAHREAVDRLVKDTAARLAKAKEAAETVAAALPPAPEGVEDITGAGIAPPPIPDIAGELGRETEDALIVWEEFNSGMKNAYSSTWQSILDADLTGKQRREQIWMEIRDFSWNLIGEIVQRWIWGEAVKLFASKATATTTKVLAGEVAATQEAAAVAGAAATVAAEQAGAAAAVTGAATKIGASIATSQANQLETTTAVASASADVFKAHARFPLVGIAIAIGLIATMIAFMKSLPKFARGGFIHGRALGDTVPLLGEPGEFIIPRAQSREFAPLLEAIRTGDIPDMASLQFAGAGGGNFSFSIIAEQGSLLVAEDESAWDRVATRIHNRIEDYVRPKYRPRS